MRQSFLLSLHCTLKVDIGYNCRDPSYRACTHEGETFMSDHTISVSEKDSTLPHSHHANENQPKYEEAESAVVVAFRKILDQGDSLIYAIVGICFFIGALLALIYSFWDFGVQLAALPTAGFSTQPGIVVTAIIKLVSDLLLVLIIMEVLGTVIHYLKAHATSLRPFLFIGIVSATRGILSIGARLSVEKVTLPSPEFTSAMVELGVNAAVILALGITLKLLGKLIEQ